MCTLFLIPPETCKVSMVHVNSHSSRMGTWDFEYRLQQQRFDLHLCILVWLVCIVLLAHMYVLCLCQFSTFLYIYSSTVSHYRHVHLLYSLASMNSVNAVYSVHNTTPNLSAQSRLRLLASTCFCWNPKCSTWGGYRSKQSSNNYHQYATLTRPNKAETAVCGSSIFVCWMTGEAITGCHK